LKHGVPVVPVVMSTKMRLSTLLVVAEAVLRLLGTPIMAALVLTVLFA